MISIVRESGQEELMRIVKISRCVDCTNSCDRMERYVAAITTLIPLQFDMIVECGAECAVTYRIVVIGFSCPMLW